MEVTSGLVPLVASPLPNGTSVLSKRKKKEKEIAGRGAHRAPLPVFASSDFPVRCDTIIQTKEGSILLNLMASRL